MKYEARSTNIDKHPQKYLDDLNKVLSTLDKGKLIKFIEKIQALIGEDKTLFICGNGGSAATSSHMACDLGKTILGKNPRENSKRLKTICLNDCVPMMTAWGNDEGYEHIFSEQLRNLGQAGDMLLIITGSGNSPNILEAIKIAKEMEIETFGLLGFQGGKAKGLLDDYLLVKSENYGIVEDIHGIINHLITDYLKNQSKEEKYGPAKKEESP
ncbi:MAG: SIS domain-containing protein [Candidatus Moranbacteria bacterium]|nr:SIS domain-containing protein [Candidatus Moranbacteria bacterium]